MTEDAQKNFKFMEHLYGLVYPLAIYDNLVGGLKRKLDVAKILIEDVQSTNNRGIEKREHDKGDRANWRNGYQVRKHEVKVSYLLYPSRSL